MSCSLTICARFFITGGSEGLVSICSLADGVSYRTLSSYTEEVRFAKPSWDGEYLAVGGGNDSIDLVSGLPQKQNAGLYLQSYAPSPHSSPHPSPSPSLPLLIPRPRPPGLLLPPPPATC